MTMIRHFFCTLFCRIASFNCATAFSLMLLAALPLYAERIIFSANSMTGTAGNSSDKTTLRGNAYVLTSSMEISADAITMSGKDFRYIEADGNISGKNLDTKMEFTCGKLSYDRETKIATLRDSVHLDDTENNVTVEAQIIEYNQDTDTAIIQIDITLKHKDNVCKSMYAIYRKKAQMLELSGNSQITQGEDTFRAQEITLNLDTQEITLDGRVKGSVVDNKNATQDKEMHEESAVASDLERTSNAEQNETAELRKADEAQENTSSTQTQTMPHVENAEQDGESPDTAQGAAS